MASISLNNLCKCWKKPARNSDIFHHPWQLVYNLQWPILYHILIRDLFLEQFLSFRNLILSFKNAKTIRFVAGWHMVKFS